MAIEVLLGHFCVQNLSIVSRKYPILEDFGWLDGRKEGKINGRRSGVAWKCAWTRATIGKSREPWPNQIVLNGSWGLPSKE
jgi:hypothetical protein